MIHLCYSNRVEALIDALAAALPPLGDADALFGGPWLVVPSRPLELYVDLELARLRGVSGNVDTMSMRGALARLCAEASRDNVSSTDVVLPDVVLIERAHLVGELFAALSDPVLDGRPALAPLHSYLRAAGDDPDAIDRRRVDVARALGGLFDDWLSTRPEVMATWRDATEATTIRAGGRGEPPTLERAERALFQVLFGAEGRFARRGAGENRRYLTIDQIFAEGLDQSWRPPGAIHVFGMAEIGRGVQVALGRLGARSEVTIYGVNPCREFWEDVDTKRKRAAVVERRPADAPSGRRRAAGEKRERGAKGGGRQLELIGVGEPPSYVTAAADEPDAEVENPLLRAWGHAARETTRLLNELAEGDSDQRFVDPMNSAAGTKPAGASLLAHLQRDVLDRTPERSGDSRLQLVADRSLAVVGAPNPRRELETVAAKIWALVREDVGSRAVDGGRGESPSGPLPLRFSDVAVMIAGPEEPYLSLARAVFREADELPHAIVDTPLAASSHLVEAVLALLALPLGKLTRREVLNVITHPNVRARFPDADPKVWLQLCDALTIAHGADRAALSHTYIDSDVFNWDQGLKRLALGRFAQGRRGGAEIPVALPDDNGDTEGGSDTAAYMPAELPSDVRADADAMALLVRSLLADAAFARAARLPFAEWARFVRALMSSYLVPLTPDDDAARLLIFSALDQIAVQNPPGLSVSLGVVVEMVRAALTGLGGARGQVLGAGVTVGSLRSLRALPFRTIFVVGLNPGRFPAADRQSPLDLEAAGARAGEVSPRQRDRGLFLDAFIAARETLILSYVDRDSLTGDSLEPSAIVLELLDDLRRGYLQEQAIQVQMSSIIERIPLHRDDEAAVRAAFPAAASESTARNVGDRLRADIPAVALLGPTAIARGLSPQARHTLAPVLKTIDAPPPPMSTSTSTSTSGASLLKGKSRRVLYLGDLRRFLECPLQGSARVFLKLRDLPDDTAARETEDEPFDLPSGWERSLLGDVFARAWTGPEIPDQPTLGARYDELVTSRSGERALPAGLFRASIRRRHLRILGQWAASLAAGAVPPRGPARAICLGRPRPFAPLGERRAPIRLRIDLPHDGPTDIEIHGITEPQLNFGSVEGSLVLATSSVSHHDERDRLRAFLDHVVLAASRDEGAPPLEFSSAVCRPSRDSSVPSPSAATFAPLDVSGARHYLAALTTELLGGVHAYLFPCEAVFRSRDQKMTLVDRVDQIRADPYYRKQSSSYWGPVPEPFDYPTPAADEADRLLSRRFGLFFARQAPDGSADPAGASSSPPRPVGASRRKNK